MAFTLGKTNSLVNEIKYSLASLRHLALMYSESFSKPLAVHMKKRRYIV
jgi:hypothetical protein